jgi:alpha-1,6-mannosyltransferase
MAKTLLSAAAALRPLRVADVALFYGERSGGIRTYLDAKRAYAATSGAFEHHLIVPGRRQRHAGTHHELRSLTVAASNGYRVPLGTGALERTLRVIRPDVVLVHDPFWAVFAAARLRDELGARIVAVHHASSELDAAGLPGPGALYMPALRAWFRHTYEQVDAVMSAIDPRPDTERGDAIPLRFGLDPAFRPRPEVTPGEHVLYAGRLAREKGVFELLEAAARSREPWPLLLIGAGPARSAIDARVKRLGLGARVRFAPFEPDRVKLAQAYAAASCVVMPGPHETFGLVTLEAAASGARVVACEGTPSAALAGELALSFPAGDTAALARAIDRARTLPRDPQRASSLSERFTWARAFEAELADLEELVR